MEKTFRVVRVLGEVIGVRENDVPHVEWIITPQGVVEAIIE